MKRNILLLSAGLLLAAGAQAQGDDVTAQYITNPGFEDCETATIVDGVVQLVANDKTPVDYESTGWKCIGGFDGSSSYNAGVTTYPIKVKYSKWLAGIDGPETAPTAGDNTKALCFTGNKSAVYQSAEVTLPAGTYTLTVNVWAYNGGTSNPAPTIDVKGATGFVSDATEFISAKKAFTSSKWDTDVITIELTEATTGRFQLSYGSSYFVTIDDLKLEYAGGVVTSALAAVIVKAKALNTVLESTDLSSAIASAEAFIADPTSQEDVATQTETLYTAMATALAASTQPVDITAAYLENASFETGKIEPWAWGSTSGTVGEPVNADSKPFIDGANVVEFAQAASNSLYQTVGHLPAGYYVIDAKLNQKAYLKVGESRTYLQGGKDALYLRVHPAAYNLAAGGELTVSASATAAFRVDGFRLFYGKDEASLTARLLQDVKADAQSILEMTKFDVITGSERTALQTALEGTDADAINSAANSFVGAKDSYDYLVRSKTAAAAYAIEDYPYASMDIYRQIQALIATEPTSAANADEMKELLDRLCMQFYISNAYCEGVEGVTDCTENILGANATESASGWGAQNMTIRTDKAGWNDPKTGTTDKVVYGVTTDYYRSCKDVASIMKQTLKGLAPGKYVLSMTMMGSNNLEVNVFFNTELIGTMKAAGTSSGGKYGAGWNDYVMTFDKADASDMPLQLQCKPTANYQEWYIDNFRLYLLPGETPQMEQCATPTVEFVDGKLKFNCETEGVEFVSTVKAAEAGEYHSDEVAIAGTYIVSVYAKKDGFQNSDIVNLTFSVGFDGEVCDTNRDGVVDVADIATVITKMAQN